MPPFLLILLRWLVRIAGSLIFLTVLVIAIGEGYPNPLLLTLHEQIVSFYMLVMILGIPIAWKWDMQGGVMLVAGHLAFRGDEIVHGVPLHLFGFLDLFLLLGVCNIAIGWAMRRAKVMSNELVGKDR